MEEPLELEDGEIIDDEPNDVFGGYKILQRPHVKQTPDTSVQCAAKMRYSDESDDADSADSESDSDSDSTQVKKPKLKLKKNKRGSWKDQSSKNDKYKVWCTQMQEESLTEDLTSCGVTKKSYQERSVESYNFTLRYARNESRNNNSSDEEKERSGSRRTNKRTNSDRRDVKFRLGKRRNSIGGDRGVSQKGGNGSTVRIIADLSTTVDSTNADVATDITNKLNEKKELLIRRVVNVIGKRKAIDFFQQTKKIEEDGGMLTMNGSRRRTAGGVYLWLVKNDEYISQEKIREIFYEQKETSSEQGEKTGDSQKRRVVEDESEKDLPALLTRAELSTRRIAEEARLRRGEGMDRNRTVQDRTVSNPPPSPVTDDPDHSEQHHSSRRVQDYSDDFLDIDSMEVL